VGGPHLHNVYRKIGAADRAQAVLVARERDWI
jgi:DNA-binding NarL/FixJ family response regulator